MKNMKGGKIMFQIINRRKEEQGNAIFKVYRHMINKDNNKGNKFLPPSVVRNKLIYEIVQSFELKNSKDVYDNVANMFNNLTFDIVQVSIFDIIDDNYINENYRDKMENIKNKLEESNATNEMKLSYLHRMEKTFSDSKGGMVSNDYILVDENHKNDVLSFFRKYGINIKYKGFAESLLESYIFTEEEYQEQRLDWS